MTALVHQCTYKKPRRGDLGLELEVEAMDALPDVSEMGWTTKNDGSLRYIGKEYVTSSPIKNDGHKRTKLEHLVNAIKKDGRRVQYDSHRTSFHVHRNVSNWEAHQPWNAAVAYFLFENLLMKYCGKHREGNQFCLRLKDATSMIDVLKNDIRVIGKRKGSFVSPFVSFNEADIKYAGLNLKAIPNYGSIEFRGMRGVVDAAVLDTWSTEMANMTEKAATQFKDPAQLMDTYFGHEPIDFLKKFFSEEFGKELIKLGGSKVTDLIQENEPLVCEIAYATDWDRWKKRVNEHMAKGAPEWEEHVRLCKIWIQKQVRGVLIDWLDEAPPEDQVRNPFWATFDQGLRAAVFSQQIAEYLAQRWRVSRVPNTRRYFMEVDRMLKRGAFEERAVNPIQLDEEI